MKADKLQSLYAIVPMELNEYFFFRGQRSLAGLARFHPHKKEKERKARGTGLDF